jgi:cytochrome c biogenesis protein CcmG, thiol:disulfide interchange protein DsbE
MRRLAYLLPVLVFAALVGWFWLGLAPGRDPSLVPSVMIDKPAPDFALQPLDASDHGLATADLKGKVTLINFFASWCVPCRAEQPLLLALAQDKRLEVDGIAWKNKPEDAAGFLAELGNPFAHVVIDQTGRTFIDFGAYGVPESYLIDRQGRIRFRQVGPLTQEVIDRQLKPMIAALAQSQTTTGQ